MVLTGVKGGSKLLMFVVSAAGHSHELSLASGDEMCGMTPARRE